jgi:N-acetylneuraminic acid mutarotase
MKMYSRRRRLARAVVETLEDRRLLAGIAIAINMQPAGAPVPAGYLADSGAAFSDRGNGYFYGWDSDISGAARDRNHADDQRFDTLIHTQQNGGNHAWEIAVPNGAYNVHLVAGDMDYVDSVYKFNVEGATALGGTPNWGARWIGGNATVNVADGRLTITNASGSANNKLCYVDITSAGGGTTTPTPPPVQGSSPFRGTPWPAGQPIEAEDYDLGGEGVAFHDSTPDHLGGGYRSDAVDVQPGGSNAFNVGFTRAGEWLKYTLKTPQAGPCIFTARVASAGAGGQFHVEIDGNNLTGSLAVPDTASWTAWNTVTSGTINVPAGTHVMRIVMESDSPYQAAVGNFDTFNLTPVVGPTLNWSTVTPSPVARFEGYARSFNGKLYTFGGYTHIQPFTSTNDVAVYDPAANRWTGLGTMPVAETHAEIAEDDATATLYFIGGLRGTYPGTPVADVFAYHLNSNTWTQMPSLPEALGGGTAAFVNGEIHYFGGVGTAGRSLDLNEHYVLKVGDALWHSAAALPVARDHLSAAVVNGKIYAFGGEVGHDADHLQQTIAQVYDPSTNAWSALAAMPQGKSHMESSTFVWNGKVILAGGQSDNFQSTATILQYDPATNTWAYLSPLPTPLQGVAVQVAGSKIIAGMGYDGLFGAPATATYVASWNL